jgi:catechol 2,3-dioxygenase-like lactoylglutathione lyase family enzyme
VGDTLLAFTQAGLRGFVVVHRLSQRADTLGRGLLASPARIQYQGGRWYVSDVQDGRPFVVVFAADGRLIERVALGPFGGVPHQFAVLPDGRLVFETPDGRLLALKGESPAPFADVRGGPKTGLVIAASGGVFHALPDKHLTLYNQFGHIRWRIDWPWLETAFVTDLTVDAHGRIYVIAGIPSERNFVVYSLSNITGEVVRWSTPGPYASFSVDRLGEIRPDTTR